MPKGKLYFNRDEGLELTTDIIEVFEEFLESKGIEIPSSKQQMFEEGNDIENASTIYGDDYYWLVDEIEDVIADYDIYIEDDED